VRAEGGMPTDYVGKANEWRPGSSWFPQAGCVNSGAPKVILGKHLLYGAHSGASFLPSARAGERFASQQRRPMPC